jgi:hypothetical protein
VKFSTVAAAEAGGTGGTAGGAVPAASITGAAGSGGAGGGTLPTALAGGTTTGGGARAAPGVNDDAAAWSDCGMLAGEDAICCTMPRHGTPPWLGFAVAIAIGLNIGSAKKAPAVPKVTMTRRFLVRVMLSPVSLRADLRSAGVVVLG